MKYFITSDNHFGHAAMIGYGSRPFKDVHHMDDRMIKNWNERVKPEDTVFHLGDFQFRNSKGGNLNQGLTYTKNHYWDQLNGHIIHIAGNHDDNNARRSIIQNMVIKFSHFRIGLIHDPSEYMESTEYNPIDFWLCGHVHQNWRYDWRGPRRNELIINVGVDQWKFYPQTLDEIIHYHNELVRQHSHGIELPGKAGDNIDMIGR